MSNQVETKFTSDITVKFIQGMGGDHMIAAAARVSTNSDLEELMSCAKHENKIEENVGLINYLMKHRHGTPFEHSGLTFFVHAPIFVWREWQRHRIAFSYNEESGRYKQLDPTFWIPRLDRKMVPTLAHKSARPSFQAAELEVVDSVVGKIKQSCTDSYTTYLLLLSAGIAKEVARVVLPVGIYSSCWVTCNPRSLMAFLSLRTHEPTAKFVSYPQAEIEEAARATEAILAQGWPITYQAFVNNGRVAP